MGNVYTSPTLTGYNANPPSDDGSATAANEITWAKHKDKIGDPLKTYAEAVSTNVTAAFAKIFGNGVTTISSNYTLQASDRGKLLRLTTSDTITFLAAATAENGFVVAIDNPGGGTMDGNGSEEIDGATTVTYRMAIYICDGTGWRTIARVGTLGLQDASSVAIAGGSIDGVVIGTTTPATQAVVDNIDINGNTISTTDPDGDLVLSPNGIGGINVSTSTIKNVVDPASAQDAATKNYVDTKIRIFTSSAQAITSAGALTLAHGLGGKPDMVWCVLTCTTGEHNYSIGDEVLWQQPADEGDTRGFAIELDATNLNIRYANSVGAFGYLNKTGGGGVPLTNARWTATFKAVRYT